MKRYFDQAASESGEKPLEDPAAQLAWPTLLEHLGETEWDDGGPREPSALTIKLRGGQWNLMLTDFNLKASAFTTALRLAEGLDLLEAALASGQIKFHRWKDSGGGKGRRRG